MQFHLFSCHECCTSFTSPLYPLKASTMPWNIESNPESVFYQLIGLSFYTKRGIYLYFHKAFYLLGVSLAVLFLTPMVVMSLSADTQFFVYQQIMIGNSDTTIICALINWAVDTLSAVALYLTATLTQEDHVNILNGIGKLQLKLRPLEPNKRRFKRVTVTLLSINLIVTFSSIFLNTQEVHTMWEFLFMISVATMEICFFRILSTIHQILTALKGFKEFLFNKENPIPKQIHRRELEIIQEILETFTRSNRLSCLVLACRILMSNITMIYSSCYIYSINVLGEYLVNFVWIIGATVMIDMKFLLMGYYCEAAIETFNDIIRQSSGSLSQHQRLHYGRTRISTFGLFGVDRRLSFMVGRRLL